MSERNIITISIIKCLNGLSELQVLNLIELLNEWQYMIKKIFENNLKNIWICSISKGFNVGSYYLATAKRLLFFISNYMECILYIHL